MHVALELLALVAVMGAGAAAARHLGTSEPLALVIVGCCDSSPPKHATAHFRSTAHPVMRSIEPGEAWRWCYVDDLLG